MESDIANPIKVAIVPKNRHARRPLGLVFDVFPNVPNVRANREVFLSESLPINAVPARPKADRTDVIDP
jgi:hypothetical protein